MDLNEKQKICRVENFYQKCISYLERWTEPLTDFKPFNWILFNDSNFKFNDVVPSIDDSKLIDQNYKLERVFKIIPNSSQKWCHLYKNRKNLEIV